jgi:hypothetical protein
VGLAGGLLIVFLVFCLLMAGVLAFCLRERRKVDGFGKIPAPEEMAPDQMIARSSDADDDNRVAMVLFGTIVVGALLALITGYLVFFRNWN